MTSLILLLCAWLCNTIAAAAIVDIVDDRRSLRRSTSGQLMFAGAALVAGAVLIVQIPLPHL